MTGPAHGPDEVRRIAALARLRLTEDEVESLAKDFARILGYVEGLQSVADAAGAEPLVHAVPPADPAGTLRPDEPGRCLPRETVLGLAPDRADAMVRVPRVLEEGR